jgi:hypothetical protein
VIPELYEVEIEGSIAWRILEETDGAGSGRGDATFGPGYCVDYFELWFICCYSWNRSVPATLGEWSC